MAAAYITLGSEDLFKEFGPVSHLISFPEMDALVGAGGSDGAAGLALYTEVGVQLGETLQYFLTFDDVTKYVFFGKGLGNITLNGMLFSDCDSTMPGLDIFFQECVSQMRGEQLEITIGSTVFTVTLNSSSVSIIAEPDTMAAFQLVFSVLNHNL